MLIPVIINNYSSSLNGLCINRGPHELLTQSGEDERNNCLSKIQLVGQKYQDKTTLASKTQFSRHCFGFQSRCFLLQVGYNM